MLETKLGIDFGSANIAIYVENRGIVISEPSVVVCDRYSGKIMAQGEEADRMKEKLPASMQVIYPIKDGVLLKILIKFRKEKLQILVLIREQKSNYLQR